MFNKVASSIVSSCIRHMSTKNDKAIAYEFLLETEFARFKLWNHGFDGPWDDTLGTVSSQLDEVLTYSIYLQESTISILSTVVSCLLMREFEHGIYPDQTDSFLLFPLTAISVVGNEETRAGMQSTLDDAIAIYPHIDNACWDTDSEETPESAIEQLRDIIDSLFQLASPLNDQRKKLGNAIDQLTLFYKQWIVKRFPNAREHLVLRCAKGSKDFHEHVRSLSEKKGTPPKASILSFFNLTALFESETNTPTMIASAHDSSYSSMGPPAPSYLALMDGFVSGILISRDQAQIARLPSRPTAENGFLCPICSEPQSLRSRRVLSSKWR